MNSVIQLPVIAGVELATDADGRYNLKMLHQAAVESGVTKDIRPNEWMALQSTKEMAEVLITENPAFTPIVSKPGRYGGTFVHELLAISYAGWISPAFQLKVNQVFMDYRTGKLAPTNQNRISRKELAQMVIEAEEEAERLRIESSQKDERIEKLENFFQAGMTITAFGKMLNGVNCMEMNSYCMAELGWLYNESRSGKNKRYRVKSYARDRFLTETDRSIGVHGADSFIKYEPKLLKVGAQKLYDLYLRGELPMKKSWNGEFVHMKFEGVAA